jgi:hypothetical protein
LCQSARNPAKPKGGVGYTGVDAVVGQSEQVAANRIQPIDIARFYHREHAAA